MNNNIADYKPGQDFEFKNGLFFDKWELVEVKQNRSGLGSVVFIDKSMKQQKKIIRFLHTVNMCLNDGTLTPILK